MSADLAALADAIGAGGVSPDNMVLVTTPGLAVKLRMAAGPRFNNPIFSSAYLTASGANLGTAPLIALCPEALCAGYDGTVQVEASDSAVYHEEDVTPLPIGQPGNVVAAPTRSTFQTDVIALRVRARCAWCIQSNAIAFIAACTW
jgi:hypothetical protein